MNLFGRVVQHAYQTQRRVQRRVHAGRIAAALRKRDPKPSTDVRRVAVVSIGLLGDTIMTVPAIRALRKHYPKARITAVVLAHTAEFLQPLGIVDEMVVSYGSVYGWRSPVRSNRAGLARLFKQGNFDVGVVLLGHDFAGLLVEAGVPVVVGPADSYFARFFTHRFELDPRTWTPAAQIRAIELLGFRPDNSTVPELVPAADSEARANLILQRANVAPHAKFLVLHPYAGASSRSFPPAWRSQIQHEVAAAADLPVLLVGRSEEPIRTPDRATANDLTNQLSIADLMAVMARAAAVISTDSGPLHLAAALGVPVIGLFRAIRPELATVYPNVTPLFGHGPASCQRECTWDSYEGCVHHPCAQLLSLSPDAITDAVLGVLRCASR